MCGDSLRGLEQHALTFADLDNWLQNEVSFYRALKQGGSRVLGAVDPAFAKDSTELRRQDVAWLSNITRRYADEMGIDTGARLQFQRVGKTQDSPFKDAIKQDLLTGNRAEARNDLQAYLASKPAAMRDTVLESLKASVRASQPLKVGASTSEATKQLFLTWAQQRLTPVDVARIRDIDQDYRQTAVALGLMSPETPVSTYTPKNQQILQHIRGH